MALRLPGGISTPSQFWDSIISYQDAQGPIPKSRFNASAILFQGQQTRCRPDRPWLLPRRVSRARSLGYHTVHHAPERRRARRPLTTTSPRINARVSRECRGSQLPGQAHRNVCRLFWRRLAQPNGQGHTSSRALQGVRSGRFPTPQPYLVRVRSPRP